MGYEFRTITDDDRRNHLDMQLRSAEADLLSHSTNAELADVSGDDNVRDEQQKLADAARARAELLGRLIDEDDEQREANAPAHEAGQDEAPPLNAGAPGTPEAGSTTAPPPPVTAPEQPNVDGAPTTVL